MCEIRDDLRRAFCAARLFATSQLQKEPMVAQKVLITAGGGGIGLELARAFRGIGSAVYVCDIDTRALGQAKAQLPGLHTGVCDIGDRLAVESMVSEAVKLLGGLDVLINNAGIGGPTRPVQEIAPEEWDAVLRVGLTGAFHVTRCAIPHLIRSGNGVIINMASAAGRFGYPNRSPYATTKWGLIGFTKTLSMELGQYDIRANAIAPGAVEGERAERVFAARAQTSGQSIEEEKRAGMANQSLKRFVDPRDIGALCVFLASDAGKSISGQVLPIDGDHQRN
jgi:NAD(P)-dependent dehydrogenase (short-subunit alcohol dehydrogenase family)